MLENQEGRTLCRQRSAGDRVAAALALDEVPTPYTLAVADQVAADDVDVLVVRHVDADHLPPEVAGAHDQPAGHDAVAEDLLLVVDVVDEAVERADALLQPGLDQPPLVGRDQARDEVEGEDALGALLLVGVDGEGDPLVQERAVGEVVGAVQVARVERRQVREERPIVRARADTAARQRDEHLVVEAAGVVPGDERPAEQGIRGTARSAHAPHHPPSTCRVLLRRGRPLPALRRSDRCLPGDLPYSMLYAPPTRWQGADGAQRGGPP